MKVRDVIVILSLFIINIQCKESFPCKEIHKSYYECDAIEYSPHTFEVKDCLPNNTISVECRVFDGVICDPPRIFNMVTECSYTNGYYLSTTLLISFFSGWLGIDRIYLGYVGVGVLKILTFGFLGVGWFYDIAMIASNQLRPIDGSNYIRGYYFQFEKVKLILTHEVPYFG